MKPCDVPDADRRPSGKPLDPRLPVSRMTVLSLVLNPCEKYMHRTLTLVALAASGLFASTSTVSAQTTRTVCASGCQYTSINTAIDAAQNGDVIQLAAETYFEGEQIDTDGKAITLRGVLDKAGEPASVLDGSGTHRVLICQSGEGWGPSSIIS